MAFTEAQQQLIRSVRENLDIGPDFEEDVKTLNIGNPEEEAEYLRIAQEYADLEADKAYEELEVVRNTGIVTTGLELKQHGEILKKSQSYTVYEVLQQYESPVLTQIQTQLTAAKSKESVEDFCNNIEKVWISYIK